LSLSFGIGINAVLLPPLLPSPVVPGNTHKATAIVLTFPKRHWMKPDGCCGGRKVL